MKLNVFDHFLFVKASLPNLISRLLPEGALTVGIAVKAQAQNSLFRWISVQKVFIVSEFRIWFLRKSSFFGKMSG